MFHERGRLRGQRREKAQGGGHPHPRTPGRDAGLRDVPRHRHRRRGRVHGGSSLRAPGSRPAGADLRRPAKPAPGTGRPLRVLPRARRLPQPPRRGKRVGLHPGGRSRRCGHGRRHAGNRSGRHLPPPHHGPFPHERTPEGRQDRPGRQLPHQPNLSPSSRTTRASASRSP